MSPPTLECRSVTAGYPGPAGAPKVVLADVSFAVPAAGSLVVLGRSGSGKSTLLRLLDRLEDPICGTVLFQGRPVTEEDPLRLRRQVALVLQQPVVFEGTVRDNLLTRPDGARAPSEAAMASLLVEVGLDPRFQDRRAEDLSVGEQQRVCLARALVAEPEALLLDEPTSALDPQSLGVIADLVLSLRERRRLTLVVATHQPALVRRIGGSVLLLEGGAAQSDPSLAEVSGFLQGD